MHANHTGIIELPRLIIEPTSAIGVKEYESVEFKCGFSAPAIPYLVICEWLKDGYPISNANKHPTTDPKSNITICSFNINSVSPRDEGNYYCSICYNKSFGDQFNFPEDEIIKSKSAMAVLQLGKINNWYVYLCIMCVYILYIREP